MKNRFDGSVWFVIIYWENFYDYKICEWSQPDSEGVKSGRSLRDQSGIV